MRIRVWDFVVIVRTANMQKGHSQGNVDYQLEKEMDIGF